MKEILALQLASGIEHGLIVCSRGRIIRVAGTLDQTDAGDILNIKPTWAVESELGDLAAKKT